MELKINNKNGIVESAYFDQTELSFSLFINIKKRNFETDYVASGLYENGNYEESYFFPDFDEADDYDKVSLIAETDKEVEVLQRLAFTLHSKGQLWFMYCDESVYKNKNYY